MSKRLAVLIGVVFLAALPAFGGDKKLSVRIVNRKSNWSRYTYTVPGYSQTNCDIGDTSATCTGTSEPGRVGSYTVSGATLSLLLPDGRIVVVNCSSKVTKRNWMFEPTGHRGCREPYLADQILAEFHGDNAKLTWPVSLDGKKTQSETYKIIAVIPAPGSGAVPQP